MTQDSGALLRRVRAALAAIVGSQALLLGGAVGIAIGTFGGPVAGVVCGLSVAAFIVWRSRAVRSLERAALWVEERDPSLQYALVTAADPRYAQWPAPAYSGALLRRAAWRALLPACAAVVAAVAVNRTVVAYGIRYGGDRHSRTGPAGVSSAAANRLASLTVRVEPPAYSHLPAQDLAEPGTVSSLVGSRIVVRGGGDTTGVRAVVRGEGVPAAIDGAGWTVRVVMPAVASVLTLRDGTHERLMVLAPIPDAPPSVELTGPPRDSVMREAHGVLRLIASARDDIGLSDGHFEIIVTSGNEESGGVQGKTVTLGETAFGDARTGVLAGGFRLDSLKRGDVVSIRAVVRDNNAVSGPGVGASETRTYRLATKEEYDSIAVEGAAPPEIDSSLLSQRMIVMQTQRLLGRMTARPPWPRDSVAATSHRIGVSEDRLRSRVEAILGGEEDEPGEAMSGAERALFDTAFGAMGSASISLATSAVRAALPRELTALAALDTIRQMQRRLYLRGKPPTVIVNIARVRMTGKSAPDPGRRVPEVAADTVRQRLVEELGAIIRGPLARPGIADSLTVMEADALAEHPAAAAALGDAVRALQTGHDPAPALARARRALAGAASTETGHAAWVGGGGGQ